jgi:microcystin-dependent protein
MLFQQSAAPTGWTKLVAVNDVGLRVVSGSVTAVGGVAFSTVFAQTAVGNTTLSASQIPAHTHQVVASPGVNGATYAPNAGANQGASPASSITSDGGTGGAGAHSHAVTLNLAYIDVIMASKT